MSEPTPEERQEGVVWPVPVTPMPAVFDVMPNEVDGQPAVVIVTYNGAGASFGWMPRDVALEFASKVKKVANTGPKAAPVKQTAPEKKLIVKEDRKK